MKFRFSKINFGPIWNTKIYLSANRNSVEVGREAVFVRTPCTRVVNAGYSIRLAGFE